MTPPRILTLDDNEAIQTVYRFLFRELASEYDHRRLPFFPAAETSEALRLLEKEEGRFDLLVVEPRVPGNGFYFLAEAKKHYARGSYEKMLMPPTLIVTTTPTESIRMVAEEYGIEHILGKPFENEEFLAACRSALENGGGKSSERKISPISTLLRM